MKFRSFATLSATLFTAVFSAGACTSWVLHPETTESGMMVVHKINDARYSPRDADVRTAPNGWRWIRVGGYHRTHVNMAMNEKGVAVTTNGGDRNGAGHPRGERLAIGAPQLETAVMQNCATAADGVEVLKNAARNRLFFNSKNYGYILLVADARRAFVVEIGDGYAEAAEVTGGIHVVANAWRLPGGEARSIADLSGVRGNRAREACAARALRENRVDGKYTIRGCFAASRMIRRGKFDERCPFVPGNEKAKNMSVQAACFELDPEFPEYLSCAYVSLGPQRHTPYLPIPMAVRQLPEKMRDGTWAEQAYAHQQAFGPEHADLRRIAELEDKFLAEFDAARAEARKLLREGKKDAAVKLLDDCFGRQYAEADELMASLLSAAAEKRKASSAPLR